MALYNWKLSRDLAQELFRAGVPEDQAEVVIGNIAFSQYPNPRARANRKAFVHRAQIEYQSMATYEIEKFGSQFRP